MTKTKIAVAIVFLILSTLLSIVFFIFWLMNIEIAHSVIPDMIHGQVDNHIGYLEKYIFIDQTFWKKIVGFFVEDTSNNLLLRCIYREDLSTVTSFLCFACFFSITINFFFLLFLKQPLCHPNSFPFPQKFGVTAVQLGLIGTVMGFILLSFSLSSQNFEDLQGGKAIKILIMAFSTALLSTLMALLLAYIVMPIIQILCKFVFQSPIQKTRDGTQNFTEWLEKIITCFKDLKNNISSANDEMKKTVIALKESIKEIQNFFVSHLWKKHIDTMNDLKISIDILSKDTQKNNENLQKIQNFSKEIANSSIEQFSKLITQNKTDMIAIGTKITDFFKEFCTSQEKSTTQIVDSLLKLEKTMLMLSQSISDSYKKNDEQKKDLLIKVENIAASQQQNRNEYQNLAKVQQNLSDAQQNISEKVEELSDKVLYAEMQKISWIEVIYSNLWQTFIKFLFILIRIIWHKKIPKKI